MSLQSRNVLETVINETPKSSAISFSRTAKHPPRLTTRQGWVVQILRFFKWRDSIFQQHVHEAYPYVKRYCCGRAEFALLLEAERLAPS
jgi:hypothetical protein